MPLLGKIIVTAILAGVCYGIYVQPYIAAIVLGLMFGLFASMTVTERRRVARLRQERDDTICDFRRSFDLREVDPWVVRATYEAFGAWFDPKQGCYPLRASDSIEDELKIDWEDVDDLAHAVAQRAGYDISNCKGNPLYGKVESIEDFVHFFIHQPRARNAEQGGGGRAATRPESK